MHIFCSSFFRRRVKKKILTVFFCSQSREGTPPACFDQSDSSAPDVVIMTSQVINTNFPQGLEYTVSLLAQFADIIVTFSLCYLSLSELHSTRPALSPALAAHQPVRHHAAMMSSYVWQWSCQHANRKRQSDGRDKRKKSFSASYSCHSWRSDRNLSKKKSRGRGACAAIVYWELQFSPPPCSASPSPAACLKLKDPTVQQSQRSVSVHFLQVYNHKLLNSQTSDLCRTIQQNLCFHFFSGNSTELTAMSGISASPRKPFITQSS